MTPLTQAISDEAQAWIDALRLAPHPEGGLYRETFRSSFVVGAGNGDRAASTAIYFLLLARSFSAMHRVRSDEVWHHYDGDPVDLHTIDAAGTYGVLRLGRSLDLGHRPQHVIAAGVWQAAVSVGTRFSLCGCTVAPGFDFADFEMPPRAELVRLFPQHSAILERLTRS
jgi:predicted cupin superfamily sugar epimerase